MAINFGIANNYNLFILGNINMSNSNWAFAREAGLGLNWLNGIAARRTGATTTTTTTTNTSTTSTTTSASNMQNALADVVESISLEKAALAHIINAEIDEIKKALVIATNIHELKELKSSVRDTFVSVREMLMLLQFKLEQARKIIDKNKEMFCMSAPVIETPASPVSRAQAVADIIESIALEETGIAHILNAEGEKIQTGAAIARSVADLVSVNASVKDTLANVVKSQMLLQFKLEEIAKF